MIRTDLFFEQDCIFVSTMIGIVLSTLREAFCNDYQLTGLSDGCTVSDEGVHQCPSQNIFPKQGDVMTIDDWKKKNL